MKNKTADTIKLACEFNGIDFEYFLNALNSVNPDDLTDSEIELHAEWCADQLADE